MYLNGSFTEDRRAWEKELQGHCAEIHVDPEQTKEEQEKRITMYKQDGGRHFTEQRRVAEITIDFVLQARAKMSENKVNGPGDSFVSEKIKQLQQEQIYEITRCFQNRFFGLEGAPISWRIVQLVFLRKPDAAPTG